MVLVSCCKDNTTPAQNQIFRCGRRFRAGGASAVGCPALRGANACRGRVSVYSAAGRLYAAAGRLGRAHGWSRLGREPCGVCGVSRAMPERGVPEEFRGTSGHKKAADRASSVCRRQEFYLKVGVVTKKLLGCATPALGNWFPASPAPSRRTAPDIAEREAKLIRLRGSA
jgi:hypothetical protein